MRDQNQPGGRRGVTTVIGFVLVISIVIGGTTLILVLAQGQVSDTKTQYAKQRAENAMAEFDSHASLVALGASSTQEVQFGQRGGDITVNEGAGRLTITIINGTGNRTEVLNTSLGAVRNEVGNTDFVYQGGGVWRHQNGHTRMVSSPEFHYRDRTLTFPAVVVEGDYSGKGSSVYVENNGTNRVYPNETLSNPLSGSIVRVEVQSRYHEGWADYFETRTQAGVDRYPSQDRVAVNLTTPIESLFDSSVTTTESGSGAIDPESCINSDSGTGFECPTTTGEDLPSATPLVEDEISECESGGCQDLSAEIADGTLENGTYYHDGDFQIGPGMTTLDTSSGNINIVVNGDLTFKGSGGPGTTDVEIVGDGGVKFHVKGNLEASGNPAVNTGGDPSQLLVLVHSSAGEIGFAAGTPQFTGVLYAPNTDFEIRGGGAVTNNVFGAVVADTATANGNGYVEYDETLDLALNLRFDPELTYLHVTKNRVNISG